MSSDISEKHQRNVNAPDVKSPNPRRNSGILNGDGISTIFISSTVGGAVAGNSIFPVYGAIIGSLLGGFVGYKAEKSI